MYIKSHRRRPKAERDRTKRGRRPRGGYGVMGETSRHRRWRLPDETLIRFHKLRAKRRKRIAKWRKRKIPKTA
eukprot:14260855-Heterocapsa_arctica.AAC.1